VDYEIRSPNGALINHVHSGQDITLGFKYLSQHRSELRNVQVAIGVQGKYDETIFHLSTTVKCSDFEEMPSSGIIRCNIPNLPLQPGRYIFNLFCAVAGETADWIQNAGVIDVHEGDFFGTGKLPPASHGSFIVHHVWSFSSN
jgi:lipopolysaccharide transport system ATP-binding protein